MSKLLNYYTKKKDVVNLPSNFNEELEIGDFLKGTKQIGFGMTFNKKLTVGVIPSSVKEIIFGYDFDQELEIGVFPNGITSIIFGSRFNQKIIKDVLPDSLITLKFSHNFSQEFEPGVLPDSLEELTFYTRYKQIITHGILPQKLKKLHLCNNIIEVGSIPNSVEYLNIDDNSNFFGEGFFPTNLKLVVLPHFCYKINECVFPPNLEIIHFERSSDVILKDGLLPESVHTVVITGSHTLILNSLPHSITTIVFSNLINEITNIPPLISKIKIRMKKDAKFIKKIPFGCVIETIGGNTVDSYYFN
jgi:hypothetical protein